VQQRLADAHERDGAGAGGRSAGTVAALRGEPVDDGLERLPFHEALGLVPGVPHAGRAGEVAGVRGLDVDLAEDVGWLGRPNAVR